MTRILTWARYLLFAVLLAITGLATLLAVYSIPWPAAFEIYDKLQPVLTLNTREISRNSDSVTLHLTGERHYSRACDFKEIAAFTMVGQVMRDVNLVRIDREHRASNRPPGFYDFGVWMLWPVPGVGTAIVYVRYDCAGRDVFVQSQEVKL